MQLIKGFIHGCNKHALKASMVIILFMMFITVGDVLGRYFLNKPIPGTFELTRISLVSIVFLSLGYAQLEKVNISINLLFSRFPKLLQKILEVFISLISLGLFSVVSWQLIMYADRISSAGQYTTVLRLPMHPWIFVAAVGALLLCLALLWDLIEAITKLIKGDVMNES